MFNLRVGGSWLAKSVDEAQWIDDREQALPLTLGQLTRVLQRIYDPESQLNIMTVTIVPVITAAQRQALESAITGPSNG